MKQAAFQLTTLKQILYVELFQLENEEEIVFFSLLSALNYM